MAETLGSLSDKLTIKAIREFHLKEMAKCKRTKASEREISAKLRILKRQKESLLKEMERFIARALKGKVAPREEKLKLYNKPGAVGRIGKISLIARGMDGLMKKNLELWHLEDEARREDVPLAYIGGIKRKIDLANQQRNDLIDKIDEILEKRLKKHFKR